MNLFSMKLYDMAESAMNDWLIKGTVGFEET